MFNSDPPRSTVVYYSFFFAFFPFYAGSLPSRKKSINTCAAKLTTSQLNLVKDATEDSDRQNGMEEDKQRKDD